MRKFPKVCEMLLHTYPATLCIPFQKLKQNYKVCNIWVDCHQKHFWDLPCSIWKHAARVDLMHRFKVLAYKCIITSQFIYLILNTKIVRKCSFPDLKIHTYRHRDLMMMTMWSHLEKECKSTLCWGRFVRHAILKNKRRKKKWRWRYQGTYQSTTSFGSIHREREGSFIH